SRSLNYTDCVCFLRWIGSLQKTPQAKMRQHLSLDTLPRPPLQSKIIHSAKARCMPVQRAFFIPPLPPTLSLRLRNQRNQTNGSRSNERIKRSVGIVAHRSPNRAPRSIAGEKSNKDRSKISL